MDIYDFRNESFTTYKFEWDIIHNSIYKSIRITGEYHKWATYFRYFKKYKPELWANKCHDKILWSFIVRSRIISHHELIYLPSKNQSVKGID